MFHGIFSSIIHGNLSHNAQCPNSSVNEIQNYILSECIGQAVPFFCPCHGGENINSGDVEKDKVKKSPGGSKHGDNR